ncbi:MAG: hypothetical protein JSW04_07175 [Desulfobacterales bacterium]|nr:MAG: hypothetical protein JSV38_00460 [Desulfobacterales bacterium]UCD91195.1 MAG: hypothetical protein JSW04_07175 [Desulfobacterales bacterium]
MSIVKLPALKGGACGEQAGQDVGIRLAKDCPVAIRNVMLRLAVKRRPLKSVSR